MVVPRSWGRIVLQRDADQARLRAAPSATDARFKAAAFFLFASWLITVFSLHHSIKHFKPRNRGLFNRAIGLIRFAPIKFLLTLPLSLAMIGYAATIAFDFDISPLNINVQLGWMYGLGWGSITAILLIYEVAGYVDPNEDRDLIRQRRIRGAEADQEMGITKKPHWWSRLHGVNGDMSVHERIKRNVGEIGGGAATTRGVERSIEMGNMLVSKSKEETRPENIEAVRIAAGLLFPARKEENVETQERFTDRPDRGRPATDGANETGLGVGERSDSIHSDASAVALGAKPQVVRSMLDV